MATPPSLDGAGARRQADDAALKGWDAMSNSGHVRREVVLAICCMSILIVGLDVTILNVALPSIQKDFGASVSGAQWTIDAYTLVIACLLMLSGSTGDRLGRRRTFQLGLLILHDRLGCSAASPPASAG